MKILLAVVFFIPGVICLAVESNPLLGRWSWSEENCKKSAFIFTESSFTYLGDADGEVLSGEKYKVRYDIQSKSILVSLDKTCSLCMGKKELFFNVIDGNDIELIRYKNKNRKIQNKLVRCSK